MGVDPDVLGHDVALLVELHVLHELVDGVSELATPAAVARASGSCSTTYIVRAGDESVGSRLYKEGTIS